jgi:hypothetical protein
MESTLAWITFVPLLARGRRPDRRPGHTRRLPAAWASRPVAQSGVDGGGAGRTRPAHGGSMTVAAEPAGRLSMGAG